MHKWNREFRKEELFMGYKKQETKFNLTPFLLDKPNEFDTNKIFVRNNIYGISVHKFHEYTHEQVIPHVTENFLDRNWS